MPIKWDDPPAEPQRGRIKWDEPAPAQPRAGLRFDAPTQPMITAPAMDPMGSFTGMTEAAPRQQDPSKGDPTLYARSYGKGAVGSIVGLPAELTVNLPSSIESLGRLGLRAMGAPVSQETAIPRAGYGVPEATKYLFNEEPTAAGKAFTTAGEVLGVPTGGAITAGAGRIVSRLGGAERARRRAEAGEPFARYVQEQKMLGGMPGDPTSAQLMRQMDETIRAMETQGAARTQQKIDALSSQADARIRELIDRGKREADALRAQGTEQGTIAASQIEQRVQQDIASVRQKVDFYNRQVTNLRGQSEAGVQRLGQQRELTDIGSDIQRAGSGRMQAIEAERSAVDNQLRAARDQIVRENEAAGRTIASTPEAQRWLSEIERRKNVALRPEIEGRDPSRARLEQRVYETLRTNRRELTAEEVKEAVAAGNIPRVEMTETGPRYFRDFKSSFEAIDDLRRFMGKVFSGNPPAGYESILGTLKKDYYKRLDDIQNQYVGSAQPALQANWREGQRLLDQFENKYGRALTEIAGPEGAFAKDPKGIPAAIFNSRSSIDAAINLTGDARLIQRTAGEYLRNAFANKTADQVRTFINNPQNRDWLSHPAMKPVLENADRYATDLSRYERASKARTKFAETPVKTEEGRRTPVRSYVEAKREQAARLRAEEEARGVKAAESKLTQAEKDAEKIRKTVEARKGELEKAGREETARSIEQARENFKRAQEGAAVRDKYDELTRLAELTYAAEKRAQTSGAPSTIYTYEKLLDQAKKFVEEQGRMGRIDQDVLLDEVRRLDSLSAALAKTEPKSIPILLKRALARIGGK